MDSAKPRLLDEVRQALRRSHYFIRTEEALDQALYCVPRQTPSA